jgi:uncharacterized membrane protein
MDITKGNPYAQALALGFMAGLRSVTPVALLSRAVQDQPVVLSGSPLAWLATPPAANGLPLLAVAELVGDKLPLGINRTDPVPFAGRIAAGALIGATIFTAHRQAALAGAALGVGGAVAGTLLGLRLRVGATERLRLPGLLAGLIEDGLMAAGSLAALRL